MSVRFRNNGSSSDMFPIFIETVTDKVYKLVYESPISFSINSIAAQCESGNAEAEFQIDGVDITDSELDIVTAGESSEPTANNVVNAGQEFTMEIITNTDCLGATITIGITKL